ncbi:Glycosyl hydrolase, family 88 [Pseudohyphozyma bogoriensis]|nr:Glycosyl hydrolase, family 88 [Pseudohyphozyma bogoriensis]
MADVKPQLEDVKPQVPDEQPHQVVDVKAPAAFDESAYTNGDGHAPVDTPAPPAPVLEASPAAMNLPPIAQRTTPAGAVLTGGYNTHKIFIGNLPETATLADLEDCFGKIGQCTCSIKRGFGFVEFTEASAAADAVAQYNEGFFLGAQIKVELSHARAPPPKGPGGPGGPSGRVDNSSKDGCYLCGDPNHWARECPNEGMMPMRNPPGSDRPSDSRKPMHINGPPGEKRRRPPMNAPPPPRFDGPPPPDYMRGRPPPPPDRWGPTGPGMPPPPPPGRGGDYGPYPPRDDPYRAPSYSGYGGPPPREFDNYGGGGYRDAGPDYRGPPPAPGYGNGGGYPPRDRPSYDSYYDAPRHAHAPPPPGPPSNGYPSYGSRPPAPPGPGYSPVPPPPPSSRDPYGYDSRAGPGFGSSGGPQAPYDPYASAPDPYDPRGSSDRGASRYNYDYVEDHHPNVAAPFHLVETAIAAALLQAVDTLTLLPAAATDLLRLLAPSFHTFAATGNSSGLSQAKVNLVKQQLNQTATLSWEIGTHMEALLEYDLPSLSVYAAGSLPFPSTPHAYEVLTTATNIVANKTAGSLQLITDGSSADPASIGPAVLLANATVLSGNRVSAAQFFTAATEQVEALLQNTPKTTDGAISHRTDQVELWSDFVFLTQNETIIQTAYQQCELYRHYLQSNSSKLWTHIIWGSNQDTGLWATGNGWAANGMLRVAATLLHSSYASDYSAQINNLTSWSSEIVTAAFEMQKSDGFFPNYFNSTNSFSDAASAALLAAASYRLAYLNVTTSTIASAEITRQAVYNAVSSSTGILSPVVDPLSYGQQGTQSPEAEAFVLLMDSAWRDWYAQEGGEITEGSTVTSSADSTAGVGVTVVAASHARRSWSQEFAAGLALAGAVMAMW